MQAVTQGSLWEVPLSVDGSGLHLANLSGNMPLGVTGQLADTPTRGLPTRGLVNSRTSQIADWTSQGLVNSRTR